MKLKQYLKEQENYKIYLDLDGVLTDFIGSINKMFHVKNFKDWKKMKSKKRWEKITAEGIRFWSKMPWTHDGRRLWNYLKDKYDITILSAHPSDKGTSVEGKKEWITKNLGPTYAKNAIITLGVNKQKYANKNSILIDDSDRNIRQWRSKGGIGILHKSANDSIKQLEKINEI
jgi:hypothetical protein